MKMVLNAGHGNGKSGAVNGRLRECDITQQVVNDLSRRLTGMGHKVVKARNLDVSVRAQETMPT